MMKNDRRIKVYDLVWMIWAFIAVLLLCGVYVLNAQGNAVSKETFSTIVKWYVFLSPVCAGVVAYLKKANQ